MQFFFMGWLVERGESMRLLTKRNKLLNVLQFAMILYLRSITGSE